MATAKPPKKDKKEKAALRLAQEIVQAIYENGMRPGDRYFSEAEALERHGVARATLREALRFLEMQGVITVRAGPGGGSVVGQPGWPNLASTLALLLQFDQAPLRHVLEVRKLIEPGLAELAARHAGEDEIAAMAADLEEIEANLGDFRRFGEVYHRFWCRFAESTHNSILALLSPALRAIINSTGFAPNEVYRAELLGRMRRLHGAVAAHDAEGARATMAEIQEEFFNRVAQGYPRQINRLIAWSDLDPVAQQP